MKQYYLDANALIKYSYYQNLLAAQGKQEKGVEIIRAMIQKQSGVFYCSNFALLECHHVLFKNYRDNQKCTLFGKTKDEQERIVQLIFKQLYKAVDEKSDLILDNTALTSSLLVNAQKITFRYGMQRKKIDSMDAIHIALVKELEQTYQQSVTIVTSDNAMQTICDHEDIPFFDPEVNSI
jgi:hypothetical protein